VAERIDIQEFPLWKQLEAKRTPVSFDLELTARCNNDCRHCYLNLPAGDTYAREAELSGKEILDIAQEAAEMGAVWCLLTGGEPLLREDFQEIYVGLKRIGLLVSVFTNACLVTQNEVALFKKYPPRDLEITVYGATEATYEAVTRRPGSWAAFRRGLDALLDSGLRVRLKAMALRSNVHELEEISRFCRERTKDYYRFDPLLHLRSDGDSARNEEIKAERLTPEEIVAIEQADEERLGSLRRECDQGRLIMSNRTPAGDRLFQCGAGSSSFTVGHDGSFHLCSSLWHPDTIYDLRRGTLREAWEDWVPRVLALRASNREYLDRCGECGLVNLCMCCPAHAALETGAMDEWVEYFCEVAHARAAALGHAPEDHLRVGKEID